MRMLFFYFQIIVAIWLFLLPFILCQTIGDSPTNSQSTKDFDWRAFLDISPARSTNDKSRTPSPEKEISTKSPQREINNPSESLTANHKRKTTISHNAIPEVDKSISSDSKKRNKEQEKRNYQRYREGVKKRTGYSSYSEAKLHHFRILEKSGRATDQQKEFLQMHRRKKNLSRRKTWAKKWIKQNQKG